MPYSKLQIENFFRYLAIPSQSDASSPTLPSSKGQYELAKLLRDELVALGAVDVKLGDNAILTAKYPANSSKKKSIGFCAHLDTVDVGLSPEIHPQILTFKGEPLVLNAQKNIILDPKARPEIMAYMNEEIIFSDGTSVLGADDKAAISTIMTLLAYLKESNAPHGDIYICFLPDEEIGLKGAKALDIQDFSPDYAYTIDCCQSGELIYETFNAGSAIVHIEGVSAHPMNAKGVLLNPTLVAIDIANCFDRLQTPENTAEYEGYIWIQELHSNQAKATLTLNIRDHSKQKYEEKKTYIEQVISLAKARYPRAKITLDLQDVYANIADCPCNHDALDLLQNAFASLHITPKTFPMRGGTDGSALSTKGLFVPNFFTGAHNFHSPFEFLPVKSFYQSFEVAKAIVSLAE